MLLGDAAGEHERTAWARSCRRCGRAIVHNETAPRIARHMVDALAHAQSERALNAATDAAIVRHLSTILAVNKLERELQSMDAKANAAYIHAAGVGYEWTA